MGFPKALLTWRGTTFLEGILGACYAAGIERRVVVLGADQGQIREVVDLSAVQVAVTEEVAAGPIGSIRAGLKVLVNHPVDAALVWAVDRPHVTVATIQALVAGFQREHAAIVVPAFEGRRGHPVVFGADVFDELAAAPNAEGARAVVRRDPRRVVQVPVPDPAVLEDLNTPGEYERLLRRQDARRRGT